MERQDKIGKKTWGGEEKFKNNFKLLKQIFIHSKKKSGEGAGRRREKNLV